MVEREADETAGTIMPRACGRQYLSIAMYPAAVASAAQS
jgi:hypothetical protein